VSKPDDIRITASREIQQEKEVMFSKRKLKQKQSLVTA
jgi:hypothetical protein